MSRSQVEIPHAVAVVGFDELVEAVWRACHGEAVPVLELSERHAVQLEAAAGLIRTKIAAAFGDGDQPGTVPLFSEWVRTIPARCRNAIEREGIRTYAELLGFGDILEIRNLGVTSARQIRDSLIGVGVRLPPRWADL